LIVVVQQGNIRPKSTEQTVGIIRAVCPTLPKTAVVLGSGVSALNDLLQPVVLPYEELFGIAPTVAGHAGSLTIGRLPQKESVSVAVLRGRFHAYEGHDWSVVTLAARTLIEWGIEELFLTNAAGGVNAGFDVGDLMVLTGFRDMINPKWLQDGLLPAVMADNQDCRNALTDRIIKAGKELARTDTNFRQLRTGNYCAFTGPSYETLAEIEMARRLQADAVGMSTVPELLAVQGAKVSAAAISVITNVWSDDKPMGGHDEVLEESKHASRRLDQLFRYLLTQ
jgi:purine-nucleoside phosphorylase